MVGPWVIGVRESESGYKFGVKGQKNIGTLFDKIREIGSQGHKIDQSGRRYP